MIDVSENPSDAVEMAMNCFGDDILRLAFSYLKRREDAEDVVQDTLIRFMQSGAQFETEGKMKSWLLHVAANICKDIMKSSRWKKQAAMPEGYDVAAEDDSKSDEEGEVMQAVLSLPEKYRSVIHLFYVEEYSTKEIAEIVEKKESTVRSLLKRGREKLREKMRKGEGGYAETI
jgi:RNA polymerase sigma-70 factor (ECF subfamily)